MHDVVVVGGGPAGCYAASLLGEKGFDVHLLEEHEVIGEPVDCSGVIGAEAFAALGLPDSLKLGEINNLTLVSPSNLEVRFSPSSPLACIVNRAAFDRSIAERTIASGVTLHLGARVVNLEVHNGYVEALFEEGFNGHAKSEIRRRTLRASMGILAGGPRYALQRKLGMGQPRDFLRTAQAETEVHGIDEARVFMGSRVAPGSFAWIVPFHKTGRTMARIGVSAKMNPARFLGDLAAQLYRQGHLRSPDLSMRSWVIPVRPLPRTFGNRVLAVGDAAGQTKPTTGGGIVYAIFSAEAAAHTITAAFEKQDFSAAVMSGYEKEWRKILGREIRIGAFFRRIAERLTDKEIDDLFRVTLSDGVLSAVTSKARFDWHRDVIYFALRHPALGRIFLKGLFRSRTGNSKGRIADG